MALKAILAPNQAQNRGFQRIEVLEVPETLSNSFKDRLADLTQSPRGDERVTAALITISLGCGNRPMGEAARLARAEPRRYTRRGAPVPIPVSARDRQLWWATHAPDFETILEAAGLTGAEHRRLAENLLTVPPPTRPRTYATGRRALYEASKAVCEPDEAAR
jgi:hypothetical protein